MNVRYIEWKRFRLLYYVFLIDDITLQYLIYSDFDTYSDEKARYQNLYYRQLLKHQ